jgi:hypothetical protein
MPKCYNRFALFRIVLLTPPAHFDYLYVLSVARQTQNPLHFFFTDLFQTGIYRPWLFFYFWIFNKIFGLNPGPIHFASILFHVLIAIFLADTIFKITKERTLALLASLVFLCSLYTEWPTREPADFPTAHVSLFAILTFRIIWEKLKAKTDVSV